MPPLPNIKVKVVAFSTSFDSTAVLHRLTIVVLSLAELQVARIPAYTDFNPTDALCAEFRSVLAAF